MAISVRGSLGSGGSDCITDKIKITWDPAAPRINCRYSAKLSNGNWAAWSIGNCVHIYDSDWNLVADPLSSVLVYKNPIITDNFIFYFSSDNYGYLIDINNTDVSVSEARTGLKKSGDKTVYCYDEINNSVYVHSWLSTDYKSTRTRKLDLSSMKVFENSNTFSGDDDECGLYHSDGRLCLLTHRNTFYTLKVLQTTETDDVFSVDQALNIKIAGISLVSATADESYVYIAGYDGIVRRYSTTDESDTGLLTSNMRYHTVGVTPPEPDSILHFHGRQIGKYTVLMGLGRLCIIDWSVPSIVANVGTINFEKDVYKGEFGESIYGFFVGDKLYLSNFAEIDLSGLRD